MPAANLFESPRPSNLITIPCCGPCNKSFDEDEEYFRVAVAGFYNANSAGKSVSKNRVVPRTLKRRRLRKPIDDIRISFKQIALVTHTSIEEAGQFDLDRARVDRVLTKITKGLLAFLYPGIDRSLLSFQTGQVDQFKLHDPHFDVIRQHLRLLQRGAGVYRCWHRVDTSYSLEGLWVHMFYGSATFVVYQRSDRKIQIPW